MRYPRQHLDKVKSFFNTPNVPHFTSGLEKLLKDATAAGRSRTRRLAVVLHTLAETWLNRACEAPTRKAPCAPCSTSFRAPSTDCMARKVRTSHSVSYSSTSFKGGITRPLETATRIRANGDRIWTPRAVTWRCDESFVCGKHINAISDKDGSLYRPLRFQAPRPRSVSLVQWGMMCLPGGGIVNQHKRDDVCAAGMILRMASKTRSCIRAVFVVMRQAGPL
jgi:hypothetical protein